MIRTLQSFTQRLMRNAFIDLRYGDLLAFNRSAFNRSAFNGSRWPASRWLHLLRQSADEQGVFCFWNSDYDALSHIFAGRIRPTDVLVDVGCGKGRVINWWLYNGYRQQPIIGLELDEEVAAQTRQRLRFYANVSIMVGDALTNLPAHGTLFYLFNPFEEPIMAAFKARMTQLFAPDSDITILYYNCKHVALFAADRQWRVTVEKVGGAGSPYQELAVIKRAGVVS